MSWALCRFANPFKYPRTIEPGQELAGGGGPILVEHRVRNVVQVIGRGVAENQALNDRRDEEAHPGAAVLQNGQQLFTCQRQNSQ